MATNELRLGSAERDEILRKMKRATTPIDPRPLQQAAFDLGLKTSKAITDRIVGAITPTEKKPKQPRGMNKWERDYAIVLDAERQAGKILSWEFEGLSLKLGRGARFKPDFIVHRVTLDSDGHSYDVIECREVKGKWREAARVRIKVAASKYPWCRFIAVSKDGAGWKTERFEP